MKSASVFIVDDHQIIRDSLHCLLRAHSEFRFVGGAFDAEAAQRAIEELKPELIVLDLEMPGAGGLMLARHLQEHHPEIKVVVLTGHAEPRYINEALRSGVHGFVLKMSSGKELLAALRAVLAGKIHLCPEVSMFVVGEYRRQLEARPGSGDGLSARETDVLKRIATGQTTKEIAYELGVSSKTVETHRLHLISKLGVESVAELTKYAVREGLTAP